MRGSRGDFKVCGPEFPGAIYNPPVHLLLRTWSP